MILPSRPGVARANTSIRIGCPLYIDRSEYSGDSQLDRTAGRTGRHNHNSSAAVVVSTGTEVTSTAIGSVRRFHTVVSIGRTSKRHEAEIRHVRALRISRFARYQTEIQHSRMNRRIRKRQPDRKSRRMCFRRLVIEHRITPREFASDGFCGGPRREGRPGSTGRSGSRQWTELSADLSATSDGNVRVVTIDEVSPRRSVVTKKTPQRAWLAAASFRAVRIQCADLNCECRPAFRVRRCPVPWLPLLRRLAGPSWPSMQVRQPGRRQP